MSRFTTLTSRVLVRLCQALLIALLFVPSDACAGEGDRLCYQDSTGWEVVLLGRVRDDEATRQLANLSRGSDIGKLAKLIVSERGDYLCFVIYPNGNRLVWKPRTTVVLEMKDGSRIESEGAYFIESPLQQTLYDAGKGAIPIDDDIASKEGGFAAFVRFPPGSVPSKPEGFKVYRMGILKSKPKAAMSAEGE